MQRSRAGKGEARGRGVRTRGRSRGARNRGGTRGQETQEPQPWYHVGNVNIENSIPTAMPLETPLTPKKRKRLFKPKDNSKRLNLEMPVTTEQVSEQSDLYEIIEIKPDPDERNETEQEIITFTVNYEETEQTFEPSASFELYNGGTCSGTLQNPRGMTEEVIMNIGSEDEDDGHDVDDEDQGLSFNLVIPRAARVFLEAEEDQEEHATPSVVLQWPPLVTSSSTDPAPIPESSPVDVPVTNSPVDAAMLEDLFHFKWRSFPDPPVPASERREAFTIESGPTATYEDPYEAFTAIWDLSIMEHIATETNRYAKQYTRQLIANGELLPSSRMHQWTDTNADELYRYFAIILATGIVVKSQFLDYWNSGSNIFSTPGFSAEMSTNRFRLLSRCLHFNDNFTRNPEASYREAKLHKLQPLIDHLNSRFQSLYVLNQNVALDESLTQWKGRLDINQWIPNKAASVGIKTYELCESQTGYLWRFKVHTGGEPPAPSDASPIDGKIPKLVLELVDDLKYSGRTLWMDNYYNSPALARTLKASGLDCAGTLRTNRQFVPVELATLLKENMTVGQISGCTSGDVDLLVWRDNNRVALISTYHGATVTGVDSECKPTLVYDYNICMGGVDKKDQMLSMYPIERGRTKIWYKKFFRRLLNVSVLNSYIIFQHSNRCTHRNFRLKLILKMLEVHKRKQASPFVFKQRPALRIKDSGKRHVWRPLPLGTSTTKPNQRLRRRCTKCKKRTTHECATCAYTYCVGCFTLVHNYTPHTNTEP